MAPQTELIDATGRVVFRGTQSPGGGSQPYQVAPCVIATAYASEIGAAVPPTGAKTLDTYAVQDGDRVLVGSGTGGTTPTPELYGVWIANTAGDWTRPTDYADGSTIPGGTLIAVSDQNGVTLPGTVWIVEAASIVGDSAAAIISLVAGVSILGPDLPGAGQFPVVSLSGGYQGTLDSGTFQPKASFFGAALVAQPVVPQTTPGIQDVIDALVALGLVAQHD